MSGMTIIHIFETSIVGIDTETTTISLVISRLY